ncbi:MAG: hypothetical protein ACFE9I_13935 [Candidatus Hermodarchaeota archaeon]
MQNKRISSINLLKKSIMLFLIILYITFVIALSFGPIVAGIWTLIPAEAFGWEVSKVSYLGYYSTCTFAPFSTISLFSLAFIGFFLLMKLQKYLARKFKTSGLYLKYKTLTNQK